MKKSKIKYDWTVITKIIISLMIFFIGIAIVQRAYGTLSPLTFLVISLGLVYPCIVFAKIIEGDNVLVLKKVDSWKK
jgi:hypothetical protein